VQKRVAVVVQRYGTEIIGGAEAHARILCEQLHQRAGWSIEVLTSRAKSYITWSNEYSKSDEGINGIRVKRFRTWTPRWPGFGLLGNLLIKVRNRLERYGWPGVEWVEKLWVIAQGPWCPGLVWHLKKNGSSYDLVIFFTYLYYPTIEGIKATKVRKLLIPTAHDEPAFYFKQTAQTLVSADKILSNSITETDLISRRMNRPISMEIAGLGIDIQRFKPGTERKDYILYLGRISQGKNVHELIDWFNAANLDVDLYLAGQPESGVNWQGHPRIKFLGPVAEGENVRLIQEARCLVNPSPKESLSLIVLEALACETPVLVNRHCEIFRYYESQISVVYGYSDKETFRAQLDKILQTPWDKKRDMLHEGRAWVKDRYSWDVVLKPFLTEAKRS
jgi:glycosyltransferase involved in cell wall biosynthesis